MDSGLQTAKKKSRKWKFLQKTQIFQTIKATANLFPPPFNFRKQPRLLQLDLPYHFPPLPPLPTMASHVSTKCFWQRKGFLNPSFYNIPSIPFQQLWLDGVLSPFFDSLDGMSSRVNVCVCFEGCTEISIVFAWHMEREEINRGPSNGRKEKLWI